MQAAAPAAVTGEHTERYYLTYQTIHIGRLLLLLLLLPAAADTSLSLSALEGFSITRCQAACLPRTPAWCHLLKLPLRTAEAPRLLLPLVS